MLLRVLAGILLVLFLWALFRFAMGLRAEKRLREERRRAEESAGRRVVAEIPLENEMLLFLEDASGFRWGTSEVGKQEIMGARVFLNGAVLQSWSRPGSFLPEPQAAAEDYEAEQWEVRIYLSSGGARVVPCGSLREGVSREIATAVFEAVRGAEGPPGPRRSAGRGPGSRPQ
jgi:hypothetical protein